MGARLVKPLTRACLVRCITYHILSNFFYLNVRGLFGLLSNLSHFV
jgi:hypothetical protein